MNFAEFFKSFPLFIEITVLGLAVAAFLMPAFWPLASSRRVAWAAILVLIGLAVVSFLPSFRQATGEDPITVFGSSYRLDSWTMVFRSLFLIAGASLILLALPWLERHNEIAGEYLGLLLLALDSALLACGVNDFAMLFVVVEALTITSYILVAFERRNPLSLEAGIKYLIVGAIASAIMVYGITLVFGMTGGLTFEEVRDQLAAGHTSAMVKFGFVMLLAGVGFKIAAVPFHWWVPDVYQGAPTPTAAMLSTISKAAGFILLSRLLHVAFLPLTDFWSPAFAWLAGATIVFGNCGAILQRNLKRLMGYSSISHAGYMMAGLAAANMLGQQAVTFYLFAYLFGSLLVFSVMTQWEGRGSQREGAIMPHDIEEYAGLREKSPWLAASLIVGLVSLAGVPPLIGFFGKFLLLTAVLQSKLYALATVMLAGVAASLYYYLRVIRAVYVDRGDLGAHPAPDLVQKAGLALWVISALVLGLFQQPLWDQVTGNWLPGLR